MSGLGYQCGKRGQKIEVIEVSGASLLQKSARYIAEIEIGARITRLL